MKSKRFAIIGASRIAKSHIDAILDSPNMELVAICDIVKEKAEAYAKLAGCNAYPNHQDMLQKENIDIVTIATPSGLHAGLAIDAMKAGKHVIVEKPAALTLEDLYAMENISLRQQVKLTCIHQLRFSPLLRYVKRLLDNGDLGKISHANVAVRWNRNDAYFKEAKWRGTKNMDGGALLNQAIHQIDAFFWLMGPIDELYGMTATRLRNIETEDVGTAVMRFANGALGTLDAAITVYPTSLEEGISIFAAKGTIQIGGKMADQLKHWTCDVPLDKTCIPHQEPFFKGHQRVFSDMIEAIDQDREPFVSISDAKEVLINVLSIHQSSADKKPILFKRGPKREIYTRIG